MYVVVLRGWTASAASYQLVLIPLVTILLSVRLQDERITREFAMGSIQVLIGVYLGALRRLGTREPAAGAVAVEAAPQSPVE